MADVADNTDFILERFEREAIAANRGDIPAGNPGTCYACGEHFPRIVDGMCVPCREVEAARSKLRIGRL